MTEISDYFDFRETNIKVHKQAKAIPHATVDDIARKLDIEPATVRKHLAIPTEVLLRQDFNLHAFSVTHDIVAEDELEAAKKRLKAGDSMKAAARRLGMAAATLEAYCCGLRSFRKEINYDHPDKYNAAFRLPGQRFTREELVTLLEQIERGDITRTEVADELGVTYTRVLQHLKKGRRVREIYSREAAFYARHGVTTLRQSRVLS